MVIVMTNRELESLSLQEVIDYNFENEGLLIEALSHSSYINERKLNTHECYERLEFLGDAVLELVSSEFLFKAHPEMSEGNLSKQRASLVCEKALAPCARRIQLGDYILLGHGEEKNHGNERDSILCDVIEAIIGAIYLDGGFEKAEAFIKRFVLDEMSLKSSITDYKTTLQEYVYSRHLGEIEYKVVSTKGPEHDKIYSVELYVSGALMGTGSGHSMKVAEAAAAAMALDKYKSEQE